MTSPLVRAWFAARIVDWADHAYACWRGLLTGLSLTDREWDPIDGRFLDVPVPAGSAVAAGTTPGAVTAAGLGTSPSPALNPRWRPWRRQWSMRICRKDLGGCGAGINELCVTADGKVTSPHKIRRLP